MVFRGIIFFFGILRWQSLKCKVLILTKKCTVLNIQNNSIENVLNLQTQDHNFVKQDYHNKNIQYTSKDMYTKLSGRVFRWNLKTTIIPGIR